MRDRRVRGAAEFNQCLYASEASDLITIRINLSKPAESCISTSRSIQALSFPMEDASPIPDWCDIITQLRLEAGRIMEDTADQLASRMPNDEAAVGAALDGARQAADDIQALLAAAQVLQRRCLPSNN